MSATAIQPEDTAAALMVWVRDEGARLERQILDEAEKRATALLDEARDEAQRRVQAATAELLGRAERRVADARAELLTRQRQQQQVDDRTLLDRAWQLVPEVLAERWRSRAVRARWVAALIDEGLGRLPPVAWRVEHPPGWNVEEWSSHLAPVVRATGHEPTFAEGAGVEAGLRIRAGGATLDGSLSGLLAARETVEGRLLLELRREVEEAHSGPSADSSPAGVEP